MTDPSTTYQELLEKNSFLNNRIQDLEQAEAERKQVEEALQKSEERYRQITEGLSDYLYTVRIRDGQVVETKHSPACAVVTGYTEEDFAADPYLWLHMVVTEDRDRVLQHVQEILTGKNIQSFEHRIVRKDGQIRWVSDTPILHPDSQGRLESYDGVITDITDRKRSEEEKEKLEAQNRQLQKSESLGRMAGAIAHTFNNQLGAVIGNLEMAIDDLHQGVDPTHRLTSAMQAAQKATLVSGQMLTYLGQSFDKRELMDLSDLCRRILPILHAGMPGKVVLETDLPSPGPVINVNGHQIQQVLTNLITNAWEAVADGQGTINLRVIRVSPTEIIATHCYPMDWQPQENTYACLQVTDTGSGIAEKDFRNLFDPFFSSKLIGRGLGLAVVLGIVKASGGAVTVESEPMRGSTFRVYWPVSCEEFPRQPDKASQAYASEGIGTILLVEDEEIVRDMAAAMLTRLGFSVLAAKDGVEAVEMFLEHQDEIRCVLSDLTMPRMNGWETLTALRKLVPDIPVILASGYDKAQVMSGDHPELPQVFLGKPYKIKELGDAIGQAMASKTP